jgi:hypothetical protein
MHAQARMRVYACFSLGEPQCRTISKGESYYYLTFILIALTHE